jgi:regulator of replication initiation timing
MKEKISPETQLLREALDVQVKQNQVLMLQVEKLQQQLDNVLRLLYGKKSEKKAKSEEEKSEQAVNLPEKNTSIQKAEAAKL